MKYILLVLTALTISSSGYAQSLKLDLSKGDPLYEVDTVVTTTLNKSQIYSNTISYLTSSYTDSRNVVENKDLELGEISFRGSISVIVDDSLEVTKRNKKYKISNERNVNLYFKCTVYIKDSKFKILLKDLEYASPFPGLSLYKYKVRNTKNNSNLKDNNVASDITIDLIKYMSNQINKAPSNSF